MPDGDETFESSVHEAFAGLPQSNKREKTWDECTADEKFDRLRDALKTKEMAINDLRNLISRLMNHTHGAHGEVLGPLHWYDNGQACTPGGWFDPLA